MKKSIVALTVVLGIAVGVTAASVVSAAPPSTAKEAPPAGGASGTIAVDWNAERLHIVQTPGA